MYKIMLIKPTTGQVLDSNGELHQSNEVLSYETSFDKKEDAHTQKDYLLKQVVWALVLVYNVSAKEEEYYSNRLIEEQYISETDELNKYIHLPWYIKLLTRRPKLEYFK